LSATGAHESRKAKKERKKSAFWLTEAQFALSWGVLLTLAALVGAIYLFQTSRIAETGRRVQILQQRLDKTKQENIELKRDIAEAQSLDRLQEDALQLGFTRASPGDVEYLVIPNYPDELQVAPTPESSVQSEPADSLLEALWLAMQDSVGDLIHGESP
jgi:cell division protein FtsL